MLVLNSGYEWTDEGESSWVWRNREQIRYCSVLMCASRSWRVSCFATDTQLISLTISLFCQFATVQCHDIFLLVRKCRGLETWFQTVHAIPDRRWVAQRLQCWQLKRIYWLHFGCIKVRDSSWCFLGAAPGIMQICMIVLPPWLDIEENQEDKAAFWRRWRHSKKANCLWNTQCNRYCFRLVNKCTADFGSRRFGEMDADGKEFKKAQWFTLCLPLCLI